jgi:integrase
VADRAVLLSLTNPDTARQYRQELAGLFAYSGASHPRALSDAAVNHWVSEARANNTRRGRLARACTFLRWCVRQGEADPALVEELQSRENPLRDTPPLYGKLQGKFPARWLTHEEAYDVLLGVCDFSDVGRRDELVLRLGLAGMRVAEIIRLRVGDLRPPAMDVSSESVSRRGTYTPVRVPSWSSHSTA